MILVALSGLTSLLSPLTANIYLPALPVLSEEFHKSIELINLTVTAYMVFQGVAPMALGPLADAKGRRTAFIVCMCILTVSCIGIALTPTSAYWLLVVLRCVQAAGSASTIAIGAGVIVDIVTPEQRGSFLGLSLIGPMVGPAVGPIIGGVLAEHLGWRSIFWFLAIFAASVAIILVLVYPETLRSLVGNGTVYPPWYGRPVFPFLTHYATHEKVPKPAIRRARNPFLVFKQLDVCILLAGNAVVNSLFYAVATTASPLFTENYPELSETDIGLTFLAIGGGMFAGTIFAGRLLDRSWRRAGGPQTRNIPLEFPTERVRLSISPLYLALMCAASVGYGWAVQNGVHLAVPLILHFIIGYTAISLLNVQQTLLLDSFSSAGSSITAASNLARCVTAAGLVSFVDIMVRKLGAGWTFVLLGLLAAVLMGTLLFLAVRVGPKWRRKRTEAQAAAQ
ncbi:MFS general substrate transporter [Exidia glandulosa HHB12029]|uniref:MFS general substrate transporter n=1 Tax=Exidia glandulosa HHB12029 TaxID=1314781 RepID=A0A165FPL8_EXIGL|nr:MFS general substrate transporter [Exidia glandulosa HHB12029]